MARDAIFYLPSGGEAPAPGAPGRLLIDGVEAVEVVGDGGGPARSGLTRALELIAAGVAGVLVVAQLRDAASSLAELVGLLAWLAEACADLIAVDVGFDSGEAGARQAVALLREVERWDREPHPARRPRGRPGLSSVDPELVQRLALLRGRGLSLQAIADALNADGVPTPRGGAEWRPSSVQAALGYRRPRPPVPGAPPVPPPRPPGDGAPPGPGPDGHAPRHGIDARHDPPAPQPPSRPGTHP
ncbi:MAG: recombinase family protein [Solirubrobacteraceae bacterium]